jgi:hypothetical protein
MATTEQLNHELAEIGVRLLDDAYLAWRTAAIECDQACGAWSQSHSGRSEGAYLGYRAALDREEAAARDLERLSKLAGPCRDALLRG